MASTYSSNLGIELIGTGDQSGTWGSTTNTNLGTLVEQAISGYVTQTVTTGADTTITIPNGSSGVARNMYIELTGSGGASTNLIVPANKKLYFIFNNTSSGQVTVKVAGQTGISVPNGKKMILVSNGTDIVTAENYVASLSSDNLSLTGNLTLSGGTANGVLYLNGSKVATSGSALTFDGTNLGVGTASPAYKLDVQSTGATTVGRFRTGSTASSTIVDFGRSDQAVNAAIAYDGTGFIRFGTTTAHNLTLMTGAVDRVTVDTSGNLGLGVTPSAWSTGKAIQIGSGAADMALFCNNNDSSISSNAYFNSGWKYQWATSVPASLYQQTNGTHVFYTAPSGTAGNAISFTQAMTLDASGNLGVGTTSPASTLEAYKSVDVASASNQDVLTLTTVDSTGGYYYAGLGAGVAFRSGKTSATVFNPAVMGAIYGANSSDESVANGYLSFHTRSSNSVTAKMTLDSPGNLGLGVTPSAGLASANYRLFEIGLDGGGSVYSGSSQTLVGTNIAWDGSTPKFKVTGYAPTLYNQQNGAHSWSTATSGTAGNNISFGDAKMTLDASGNLGIGTASPGYRLHVVDNSTGTQVRVASSSSGGTSQSFINTATNGRSYRIGSNFVTGTGEFALYDDTAAAARLTVDSSGNLGLGVTPSGWTTYTALQIKNGSIANYSPTQDFRITANAYYDSGNWKYIASAYALQNTLDGGAGAFRWNVAASGSAGANTTNSVNAAGNEVMTLDASGNLGVGTTSPGNRLDVVTSSVSGVVARLRNSASNGYSGIHFSDNAGTSSAHIGWGNSGVASPLTSAGYFGTIANAPVVFTTNDTERARITSGGSLLVAKTSDDDTTAGLRYNAANYYLSLVRDGNPTLVLNRLSSDGGIQEFWRSGSVVGSISVTTTATAYNTSSDRRLKENIASADDAGSVIDAIEVVKHDWKVGGHVRYGVIAQDLHDVVPEAVTVGDSEDVETLKNPWGVDYSKLVPILVKEIQSLRSRVAALEAQ